MRFCVCLAIPNLRSSTSGMPTSCAPRSDARDQRPRRRHCSRSRTKCPCASQLFGPAIASQRVAAPFLWLTPVMLGDCFNMKFPQCCLSCFVSRKKWGAAVPDRTPRLFQSKKRVVPTHFLLDWLGFGSTALVLGVKLILNPLCNLPDRAL